MPAKKQSKAADYGASQITELGFPEAIQRRPGMYIGGRSNLHHLVAEAVDNAIDEAMAGVCSSVQVTLYPDGSAEVVDDGRGVPVDIHPESGKSALEMSFTQLHTGGKFDTDSYSTSGGLHGVGIKATNALSRWLVVEVRRDGVIYRQRYEHGYVESPVEVIDPATGKVFGEVGVRGIKPKIKKHADKNQGTGTSIRFLPSDEFMEVTRFDFGSISHRLEVAAYLIPGLSLSVDDQRGEEPRARRYCYEGGLKSYVANLNEGRKVIHGDAIRIQGKTERASIDLVLQYHNGDEEEILSFVNTIPTRDGGTHVSGLRAALTKAINVFGQERKQIKSKDSITGRDTMAGLTAALSVLMPEPEFTSQTKTQLGNRGMHGQVLSLVYEGLLERFRKEPTLGRRIVDRCLAASRAREAAAKARSLVMRKSVLDVIDTGLPGKLADVAKNADTSRTILYVVEGDSAGGSCKQARNNQFHAILPLRGKILNTERARLNRALGNNEIKAIVSAVGAGVGPDFQVEDMRYGGLAIFVDADVDGLHIMTLLLTLFWRFMRPMIDAGRLYIARAPLYQLKKGRTSRYAYTDWERDQILKTWGKRGVTIQRYKGLGEMNPGQLKQTVFDVPEVNGVQTPFASQNLYRVTVEDVHQANQIVELWMGSQVAPRKERLMRVWDTDGDEVDTLDAFQSRDESDDMDPSSDAGRETKATVNDTSTATSTPTSTPKSLPEAEVEPAGRTELPHGQAEGDPESPKSPATDAGDALSTGAAKNGKSGKGGKGGNEAKEKADSQQLSNFE